MRVFRELLPFLQRHFLQRAFGIRVEPEQKLGVKVFFEVFQNERFDLRVSLVKIDRREKRLKRVREQFSLEEVLEILPQVSADQEDMLEFHGLRDAAQDLLRDEDRAELREHAFIGLGKFLEQFLANDLVQNGIAEEFQPVKILKALGDAEVLIPEGRVRQRCAVDRKGAYRESEEFTQRTLAVRIFGGYSFRHAGYDKLDFP